MKIEHRLAAMGIELESITKPMGNYIPAVAAHGLVFCSGASCTINGEIQYRGVIGADLTVEEGYHAARLAAISALAKLKYAIKNLDLIDRVVKVVAHMRTTPEFVDHASVTNGASDLFVEVFGAAGAHARLSLGCSTLPVGLPLEIEVIASMKDASRVGSSADGFP